MRIYKSCSMVVALFILGSLTSAAQAIPITLFNTGANASGTGVIANGLTDLHYTLVSAPTAGDVATTQSNNAAWVANSSTATWIGGAETLGSGSNSEPGGTYLFDLTFNLPANAILSTATISGNWAVDDADSMNDLIRLNGTTVSTGNSGFGSLSSFTIPAGSFVIGTNTLEFQAVNSGGPGGMIVSGLVGSVTIPEPASCLMLGLSAVGVCLVARRRK